MALTGVTAVTLEAEVNSGPFQTNNLEVVVVN